MKSEPIFIHSSFRTSSTWLWQNFRKLPEVLAFCEPFNEVLASISPAQIASYGPRDWSSGHVDDGPYFLEYLPLVAENGGIQGYKEGFHFERFVPADGIHGDISDEEVEYINGLLSLARSRSLVPVLGCVRSLGRLPAFKRKFGGFHVFSYRSLFDQWMSYIQQAEIGNSYFVDSILRTIIANRHDRFLDGVYIRYLRESQDGSDIQIYASLFIAFVSMHLYLYARAMESADCVVDIGRVASDTAYRASLEQLVGRRTRLNVSFGDAKRIVNYTPFAIDHHAIQQIRQLVIDETRPSSASISLLDELVVGLFSDSENAFAFAEATHRRLNSRLSAERQRADQMELDLRASQEEVQRLRTQVERLLSSRSRNLTSFFRRRKLLE